MNNNRIPKNPPEYIPKEASAPSPAQPKHGVSSRFIEACIAPFQAVRDFFASSQGNMGSRTAKQLKAQPALLPLQYYWNVFVFRLGPTRDIALLELMQENFKPTTLEEKMRLLNFIRGEINKFDKAHPNDPSKSSGLLSPFMAPNRENIERFKVFVSQIKNDMKKEADYYLLLHPTKIKELPQEELENAEKLLSKRIEEECTKRGIPRNQLFLYDEPLVATYGIVACCSGLLNKEGATGDELLIPPPSSIYNHTHEGECERDVARSCQFVVTNKKTFVNAKGEKETAEIKVDSTQFFKENKAALGEKDATEKGRAFFNATKEAFDNNDMLLHNIKRITQQGSTVEVVGRLQSHLMADSFLPNPLGLQVTQTFGKGFRMNIDIDDKNVTIRISIIQSIVNLEDLVNNGSSSDAKTLAEITVEQVMICPKRILAQREVDGDMDKYFRTPEPKVTKIEKLV